MFKWLSGLTKSSVQFKIVLANDGVWDIEYWNGNDWYGCNRYLISDKNALPTGYGPGFKTYEEAVTFSKEWAKAYYNYQNPPTKYLSVTVGE